MNQKGNDKYPLTDNQGSIDTPSSSSTNHIETKMHLFFSIFIKLTPFSMIWVSFVLTYGVICMYTNAAGQDEFYRFIFFLQKPIVIILNSVALLLALAHSLMWFKQMPNLLMFKSKPQSFLLIASLWLITIMGSAWLIIVVLS
ncbi:hypothetical protein A9G34_02305 [Gilliamella sp. Choc4-2]|jgi:fumarate reductase subunit C|uniref:hypothetical protein n=1 Tax=unclassified Gilliamella TaxID=2685620 RepID=UPI0005550470|nr:hypothetical protein [Gilliamella apicola]OCG47192.1 hypothetical protein A9G34_02305 [Gilliamella apicola]OCG61648.1 hypothetical protein A9G48_10130 [Gilliamella apicola]